MSGIEMSSSSLPQWPRKTTRRLWFDISFRALLLLEWVLNVIFFISCIVDNAVAHPSSVLKDLGFYIYIPAKITSLLKKNSCNMWICEYTASCCSFFQNIFLSCSINQFMGETWFFMRNDFIEICNWRQYL